MRESRSGEKSTWGRSAHDAAARQPAVAKESQATKGRAGGKRGEEEEGDGAEKERGGSQRIIWQGQYRVESQSVRGETRRAWEVGCYMAGLSTFGLWDRRMESARPGLAGRKTPAAAVSGCRWVMRAERWAVGQRRWHCHTVRAGNGLHRVRFPQAPAPQANDGTKNFLSRAIGRLAAEAGDIRPLGDATYNEVDATGCHRSTECYRYTDGGAVCTVSGEEGAP